ncbi:MAG: energy transducer TonB [Colwelliaceae bacterium]|nr:energy transducer TonB [Colwelliaceae bacterium]
MNKVWCVILVVILLGCANTSNDYVNNSGDIWTDIKPISGPTPIIKITPRYPDDLIQRNLSGVVRMEFIVGKDGKPTNIKPINDANSELIQEAIYTLSKNVYHPKFADNKVVVEAVFHLTNN